MSIEEKLDWILDKIKSGEMYRKKDPARPTTNSENLQFFELYPKSTRPTQKEETEAWTEWYQLFNKLEEEGFIADESADFTPYVLTIKGKMFKGYVKTKRREWWKHAANIANVSILCIAAIVAIFHEFRSPTSNNQLLDKELTPQSPIKEADKSAIFQNDSNLKVDSLK